MAKIILVREQPYAGDTILPEDSWHEHDTDGDLIKHLCELMDDNQLPVILGDIINNTEIEENMIKDYKEQISDIRNNWNKVLDCLDKMLDLYK